MDRRPKLARSAIVASALLALGVLGLFVRLQEYGPESAIRKFHQALRRGSWRDLQKVTAEDVRDPGVQLLARRVAFLMAAGGSPPRILRTDRTPNQVRAAVAYRGPKGTLTYMVWVVNRRSGDRVWRVSVEATQRVYEDAFGFGP